jgi:hypothetical protein
VSPAADGQMGCHDWSLDGLRVTVWWNPKTRCSLRPRRGWTRERVSSASGRDTCNVTRRFDFCVHVCDFSFHVWRRPSMEADRAIAYRRDSFSAKLRRHVIPDTAVYGKGVRFVLRGFVTGVCMCARHPPASARHVRHIGPGHATRQPSAGGTIPVLPRLPCPSFIIYIAAPPSLRVA